jgi:hypothetical protein
MDECMSVLRFQSKWMLLEYVVAFSDKKIVLAGDGRRLGYGILGRKYRPMKNRRIEAW